MLELSDQRMEILDLLNEYNEPLFPKEIADILGKNQNTVRGHIYYGYVYYFPPRGILSPSLVYIYIKG